GIASITSDFDPLGNIIRVSRLDENGRSIRSPDIDWAVEELQRNERGEVIEQRFYTSSATGELAPISKRKFEYDERGFPNDLRFEGRTNWNSAFKFDDTGNVIEESTLGPDGKPVAGSEGWAIHRTKWDFSADGYRQEETWFDSNNAPAYAK